MIDEGALHPVDELLEFGARHRLPRRVTQAAAALGLIAALSVGSALALQPRIETGHGSVAAPPRAAPDHSGRRRVAVGSTVRGYYLR